MENAAQRGASEYLPSANIIYRIVIKFRKMRWVELAEVAKEGEILTV